MVDNIHNVLGGTSDYYHIDVHSFNFNNKKRWQIDLFQLLEHIWPGNWHQKLRWKNGEINMLNLERLNICCLSCLTYLFQQQTSYLL